MKEKKKLSRLYVDSAVHRLLKDFCNETGLSQQLAVKMAVVEFINKTKKCKRDTDEQR